MIKAKKEIEKKTMRGMDGTKTGSYVSAYEIIIGITVHGDNANDLFEELEKMLSGIADSSGCPDESDGYYDYFVVDKEDVDEFNKIYKNWKST